MTDTRRQAAVWILVILVTVVAGWLRFTGLGDLGFFGDEETTSFATRSLAEGYGAAMPSGMPYRRALPITWLSAGVARVVGLDSELAYRIVPALLGTLAIPLIFMAGRLIAGSRAGIIASLFFALSGWHLVWSRTARMYAPLVTALIAFFYLTLKWKETGKHRYLAGAATTFLLGVLLHRVGVVVVLFPILLATMRNGDEVSSRDAIIVAILLGFAGLLVGDMFIANPFNEWANLNPLPQANPAFGVSALTLTTWVLGLIGAGVGAVWAWRFNTRLPAEAGSPFRLALAVTATLVAVACFSGWVWAAVTLAVCWLVLVRFIPSDCRLLPGPGILALLAVGMLSGGALHLFGSGWEIRSLAFTPFPHLLFLGRLMPLMIAVFFLITAALAVFRPRYGDQALRASVIFVWVYALILGIDQDYVPWRYLFPMYPWIVLTIVAGIAWAVDSAVARASRLNESVIYAAISMLIVAGGVGVHGVPAVISVVGVDYGERAPGYDQGMIGRPDHRGAGLFVKEQLAPGDIVIAEDPLEQRWYVGQVDFWLRSRSDAGKFLRRDSDGSLRDIYVWSQLLADPPDDDWLDQPDRSVWLITSLETAGRRDIYLEADQRQWLAGIESETEPVHVGRDGQTRVYCFGACSFRREATGSR